MGRIMGNNVGDVQASSSLWAGLPPQEHTDWRRPGGSVGDVDECTPRYNPGGYYVHASGHCAGIADQRRMAYVSSPPARDICYLRGQSVTARSSRGNHRDSSWCCLGCLEAISGRECHGYVRCLRQLMGYPNGILSPLPRLFLWLPASVPVRRFSHVIACVT